MATTIKTEKTTAKQALAELAQSPITFDAIAHKYLQINPDWTAEEYTGVTSILGQVLFPTKYEGIDPEILARAAQRGTRIHQLCQATDTIPTDERDEDEDYTADVLAYRELKEQEGITMIANEYLVSDSENQIASQIDCIDSSLNLYDIKTTYTLDTEYVSWQLSFYARMFEMQNPKLKAGKLFAIWVRNGQAVLKEVARKSEEQLQQVIQAWKRGETLDLAYTDELTPLIRIEEELALVKAYLAELETKRLEALEPIKEKMEKDGLKAINNEQIKVTIIADSVSKRFDSKKLEQDKPELYSQYITESLRKGYIKTTLA